MQRPESRDRALVGDPTARVTAAASARVAGRGLAWWGAVQLASVVLERRALLSTLVQAALAEWGTGRMGIAWSDPLAPQPTTAQIALRIGRGAAWGGAAACAVGALAMATHGATPMPGPPSPGLLVLGLVGSALAAVAGELLLRGVVLRATLGLLPTWGALLVCGSVAAAARFGVDGVWARPVLAEGLRAVALGALWVRDRGAWMAWAANASWTWALGSVLRGGAVDLIFGAEPDGASATLAVLGTAAMLALLTTARRSSPVGLR